MDLNNKKRNIHKFIMIICILFLACQYFFAVFSIKNNRGSYDIIRAERSICTGADYMISFDHQVYVLNRLSQVLVYDENGKWKGYYQLPYSFGGYSMYTYDDYVCVCDMTVPGNIYQYNHKGFAYMILSEEEDKIVIRNKNRKLVAEYPYDADSEQQNICYVDDKLITEKEGYEKADKWMNIEVHSENGNIFISDGFRTKLYMITRDGTKKILMEENWTDYLLYSSILKVIAVFLIFLNIIFWWVQSFRVNRKHNKKMRIKADPVKIMEEIKQNHEKIIWQGVPENGFCMNFKMIFLIIWSIFWFHGAVVMLVELPSILKVAAVLMSLIGCQPWTMIYREWADNKATRYYITDSRIIKCVTGKDFQQLFYREFHHAKILSLQRDRWVWACKNSIVFAKHPSGYKVFTYGESGDIHDLTIDYISDEEYLVEIINQQREEICKNDWRK